MPGSSLMSDTIPETSNADLPRHRSPAQSAPVQHQPGRSYGCSPRGKPDSQGTDSVRCRSQQINADCGNIYRQIARPRMTCGHGQARDGTTTILRCSNDIRASHSPQGTRAQFLSRPARPSINFVWQLRLIEARACGCAHRKQLRHRVGGPRPHLAFLTSREIVPLFTRLPDGFM